MFQEPAYSICVVVSIIGALTRMSSLGWTVAIAAPLRWPVSLFLAIIIILQTLFCVFSWHCINVGIGFFQGMLILPDGLDCLPEAEWNLTSSLPLGPVLKYGIDISLAKMVVLLESDPLWQIFGSNVIPLGSLEFGPRDSLLSCTNRDT